ncbi:Zinc finger protein [Phytophthora megakarya]|uniref:Zinc finger protein n=1 Tax=Phytophthora megakarya TaxID=4795 RepID=A0A225WLG6_9STRA|nr:Zinc finger protein [Phytophthora megakarya]
MIKWGLDPLRITKNLRDIGSNVVKACDELGVDQLGCVAHSLHLVVSGSLSKTQDDVDEMTLIQAQEIHFDDIAKPEAVKEQEYNEECNGLNAVHVTSFRKLVTFFNNSIKGKSRLKASQKVPLPVTVITDVTARWNSTHHMLRRRLELCPTLQDFLEYIQTSVGREEFIDVMIARPTGEMWFSIQCLDRHLVSFNGMTKLLSGEKYGPMPLILSSLRLVEMLLQKKRVCAKVAGRHEGEL